jgi:hypothetical protein
VDVLDADPGVILAYCKTLDIDGKAMRSACTRTGDAQQEQPATGSSTMTVLERCNAIYGVMRSRWSREPG